MRRLFFLGLITIILTGILIFAGCSDDATTTPPAAPTNIVLYSTAVQYTGDLGGRAGADAKCASDANKPTGKTSVHALISVTASDSISNMPALYGFPANIPIVSTNEIKIADNWADLLDGDIDVTLNDAAVLLGTKGVGWWSGSNPDGSLDLTNNCNGWTSTTTNGRAGYVTFTTSVWINATYTSGSSSFYLLGIAY